MPPDAKWHIEQSFGELPVEVSLDTKVIAIEGGAVRAERDAQVLSFSDIDTVVVAAGARPATDLLDSLRAIVAQVEVIGDALRPRSALEAVAEGSRVGRNIGGVRAA